MPIIYLNVVKFINISQFVYINANSSKCAGSLCESDALHTADIQNFNFINKMHLWKFR